MLPAHHCMLLQQTYTLQANIPCHTDMTGLSTQVHVAVAGTETDHLAKLINEKAEELDAACVIMASHGKTSFQVTKLQQKLPRVSIMARFMLDGNCTLDTAFPGILKKVVFVVFLLYKQGDTHASTCFHGCTFGEMSYALQAFNNHRHVCFRASALDQSLHGANFVYTTENIFFSHPTCSISAHALAYKLLL